MSAVANQDREPASAITVGDLRWACFVVFHDHHCRTPADKNLYGR